MGIRVNGVNDLTDRLLETKFRPGSIGFLAIRKGVSRTSFALVHSCVPGLISVSVAGDGTATVPSCAFARGGCLLGMQLPRRLEDVKRHTFDNYNHLYNALILPTDMATVRCKTFVKYSGLHCILTAKGGVAALNSGLFNRDRNGVVCGRGRWLELFPTLVEAGELFW